MAKKGEEAPMAEANKRIWKYTDDVLAGILVLGWLIGKGMGVDIPEAALYIPVGYVFGKHIPLKD